MKNLNSSSHVHKNYSKVCWGLLFIIIGIVLSVNRYFIGTTSVTLGIFLILIGVILLIVAYNSIQGTSSRTSYHTIRDTSRDDCCPKCGIKRSPGYNICFTCGYRFFGKPKQISSSSQQKEIVKTDSYESSFPPISELFQSKESTESHSNVSESKIEDRDISSTIQEKKKEILIKFCPECGEEFLIGAKFCFICGKKIEEIESMLSAPKIQKEESKNISPLEPQEFTSLSEIKIEENKISRDISDSKKLIPAIIKEEPKTISPPGPRKMSTVSELEPEELKSNSTETEKAAPELPDREEKTINRLLVYRKCNFCGIKLPKKAPFCLQCGMILKSK